MRSDPRSAVGSELRTRSEEKSSEEILDSARWLPEPSVRPFVRPSVRLSVRPSVRPSVRRRRRRRPSFVFPSSPVRPSSSSPVVRRPSSLSVVRRPSSCVSAMVPSSSRVLETLAERPRPVRFGHTGIFHFTTYPLYTMLRF